MRVAVVDVGSNSVRLLVAGVERGRVLELERDRVYLRLGDDAYRLGRIGARKLNELELVAEHFAQRARIARVERIESIVTAPARQSSNADEVIDVLTDATRAPVRVLTAEEEGRLAWEGAVSLMDDAPRSVGVVDLGGGSCEIAIGRPGRGATSVFSRDAGALRVARAYLPHERPNEDAVALARAGIRELLDGVDPPHPDASLAVGGTARAVGRLIGLRFGRRKLDELAERIVRDGVRAVTSELDITEGRRETLLAGILVLADIAGRLDSKLEVGRGGLREGAALALAETATAAA